MNEGINVRSGEMVVADAVDGIRRRAPARLYAVGRRILGSMADFADGEPDWADSGPGTGDGALRAAGVAVGLTVAAFVVSLVGGVAFVVPLLVLGVTFDNVAVFLALTAVGQVGFLVVGYAYARTRGLRIPVRRPDGRDVALAAAGIVGAFVVATVLAAVLAALDLLPRSVLGEVAAVDPTVLLGLAVLSVVLVAPAEEFLFRGVVQGRLHQSVGPVGAVAGASLLFGSMHLGNYAGSVGSVLAGALLIAATGSVFGILYERTRNLTVPVLAHAVYNVVLLGVAYLGV